jgi:hypothetical protein
MQVNKHRSDRKDKYVRLLFVDFTSAFNTIIPDILINKLLGLHQGFSKWVP